MPTATDPLPFVVSPWTGPPQARVTSYLVVMVALAGQGLLDDVLGVVQLAPLDVLPGVSGELLAPRVGSISMK